VGGATNLRSILGAAARDHLPGTTITLTGTRDRAAAADSLLRTLRRGSASLPETSAVATATPRRPAGTSRSGSTAARELSRTTARSPRSTESFFAFFFFFFFIFLSVLRVAKGGQGLPQRGYPWNSAMPVWEDS